MRKAIGAGMVASVMVFALSGCFAMRTLTYTKDTVQAGEKTKALISLVGDTTSVMAARGPAPAEYPFFFFISEAGSKLTNGGTFDTEGVFDGPVALKKNDALEPFAADACEATLPIARGPFSDPGLVATEDPFVATNERKFMDAKVPIRATESNNQDAFGIFMGSWADDGDGIPEDEGSSDDEYNCQPPYISTIKIKGAVP